MAYSGNRGYARSVVALSLCTCAWIVTSCGTNNSSQGLSNLNPNKVHDFTTSVTVPIPIGATGKGKKAFGSNPLVVKPGTVVTWINDDRTAHSATSDSGAWDSGVMTPGETYSHTFAKPGTFVYHCAVSGEASMSGVIRVASDDPSDDGSPTDNSGISLDPPSSAGNSGYPSNGYPDGDYPHRPQSQVQQKPVPKPIPKPYPKPTPTKKPTPHPLPTLYGPSDGGSGY